MVRRVSFRHGQQVGHQAFTLGTCHIKHHFALMQHDLRSPTSRAWRMLWVTIMVVNAFFNNAAGQVKDEIGRARSSAAGVRSRENTRRLQRGHQ